MQDYLPLIIGMALVTYIPRWLPLAYLSKINISKKTRKFLFYIPYTSLSILIVRGILTTSKDMMLATIIGITGSAIISYTKSNLLFSVLGGILLAFISTNFF